MAIMTSEDLRSFVIIVRAGAQRYKFVFGTERQFQEQFLVFLLEGTCFLDQHKIDFQREVIISKRDRPDFVIAWREFNIALEIKVGGSIDRHLRQMKRYADHPDINAVVLVGTRPYSIPETLSGKPIGRVSLGINRL